MIKYEFVHRARFTAAAKARSVVELEAAIQGMERTTSALVQFIVAEERRTKVVDRAHITYSMAAKDATDRLHRLRKTIAELKTRRQAAIAERDSAAAHLGILEATLGDKPFPPQAGSLRRRT